ncbi:MAG: cell division initiation protein [Microbacteriaceae bacterium]
MSGVDSYDFPVAFRGYDKESVDAGIAELRKRLDDQATGKTADQDAEKQLENLRLELQSERVRADEAEARLESLSDEMRELAESSGSKDISHFEEILRVAEQQADQLSASAVKQAERLIAEVKEANAREVQEARSEAQRIINEANYQAEQIRFQIESEATAKQQANEERLRQAEEKIALAEQEGAVIRSEAERLAALTRQQAIDEVEGMQSDAATLLNEARTRAAELDVTTNRKQSEAQQEFLRLHNDAVAHAQRITADANESVEAALARSAHIGEQIKASEELAKSQAQQIVSEAKQQANTVLSSARGNATELIEQVREHVKGLLRDAEDRARALRHQQQQLKSFVGDIEPLLGVDVILGLTVDENADSAPAKKKRGGKNPTESAEAAQTAETPTEAVPTEN